MKMNTEDNVILTETGEATELSTPADFGNGLAFLNPSEFPDLDNVEVGISIKPDYVEFSNAGDSVRGVFNGISEITTKDQQNPSAYKRIPAIVLQTKEGLKLNAGANLVSQLQNILPGTAIQITYKGLEPTKSGNKVKAYDVRLLNVPRMNVSPVVIPRPALPAIAPVAEKTDETEDIQMFPFNDSVIVNTVKKITKWSTEESAAALHQAYNSKLIGKALTIAEAVDFAKAYSPPQSNRDVHESGIDPRDGMPYGAK